MSDLVLKGKIEVCGIEIPLIAGGFGLDKKAILAKDIAKLHNKPSYKVNQLINDNLKRFKENIDLIDLKENEFAILLRDSKIITHNALNAMKHFYLLSERGYAKLIKIFDDDLSWERYDQILDEYFEVREEVQNTGAYITNKANPEMLREKADKIEKLSTLNETAKIMISVLEKAGLKPQYQALTLKQIYRKGGIDIPIEDIKADKEIYDLTSIAGEVGIYSSSNKPHGKAVNAIISKISIENEEKEIVSFEKNGHMGTTIQYTKSVIDKVQKWLLENNYPLEILYTDSKGKCKTFHVVYKSLEEVAITC